LLSLALHCITLSLFQKQTTINLFSRSNTVHA